MDVFNEAWADVKIRCEAGEHLRCLEQLRRLTTERPLVLWGAEGVGNDVLAFCEREKYTIKCFCDTYKVGLYHGYAIISPQELQTNYPNAVVVVCSQTHYREISETLVNLGKDIIQFPLTPWLFGGGVSVADFTAKYLVGYEWAYGFFNDEMSKEIIVSKLRAHLLNVPMRKTTNAPQYFDPAIMELSDDQCVNAQRWCAGKVKRRFNDNKHLFSAQD
jgi:hypothetical protein